MTNRRFYQPMQVDSLTLAQVAALSAPGAGEPSWEHLQRAMDAIAGACPIGLVVCSPGGMVVQGGEIVATVRTLMDGEAMIAVRLGEQPLGGVLRATVDESSAPTSCFASGVAVVREERRLQAAGRADLVEALLHIHRRWLDHRVPVARLVRGAVQP